MNRPLTILLTLIVGIAFFSCDEDDPISSNGDASQILFVHAVHDNYYWDEEGDSIISAPSTNLFGVVFGNPLPTFEYYKAGGITFSGIEYSQYLPGYIIFGEGITDYPPPITSNYDPLTVEIKTSFGTTTGTISIPDSISNMTTSVEDTLELGEPLTISWSGSNADFYEVSLSYDWQEDDNWGYKYIDTSIVSNSVTFPGSIFTYNGEIYIRIQPINGPLPEAGTTGNMEGDGSGFLYYFDYSRGVRFNEIIVGAGIDSWLAKSSQKKPDEQATKERIRKHIENKILGN